MKRILHIISQYPGHTGSGIYLQNLIIEGNKKGYIQGLVAGVSKSEKDPKKNDYIEEFYPVVFNTEKLPFSIVGMSDIMPYESTRYSDLSKGMYVKLKLELENIIKKAIGEFKPDLIISHHLWLGTSLIKKIDPDIRTIGICHGTDIRQFKKCPQYKEDIVKGCQQLDQVLSLNEEQSFLINDIYNIPMSNIKVIGGGYSKDIFYPPIKKAYNDKIRIIYAGKLSYAKGIVELIKVFDKLKDEYKIELLIVGRGTGEEEVYIKKIGNKVKGSLKFLGELSQLELGKLFRESDIFVLPSFYEGLSLVTIEALASGLLVVVNKIPGLVSYLGSEINNSGVIEYVKLPKMIEVDKPLESEIPLFEDRLKSSIETQIYRLGYGFMPVTAVNDIISNMSWGGIFNKIEKYFLKTLD